MSTTANDVNELNVYRALADFSQNAWKSWILSLDCSQKLLASIEELLKNNYQPSSNLVGLIITTIDTVLYHDCNKSRSSQRRNREKPIREQVHEFDQSLHVLYSILRRLNFETIWDQIDGTLFYRDYCPIFIFPGYPSEKERAKNWRFSHRKFILPSNDNSSPKRIPFDRVQHVVHQVEDLLNILHLTDAKHESSAGLKVCLKGRPNVVYNGPDLIWFSPVPPPNVAGNRVCPSLDPDSSRYGCFRLTLPFDVIKKYYPLVYRLGTRKYNQEHCHSYLFTAINYVTFVEDRVETTQLTSPELVEEGNDSDQSHWLCYRDNPDTAWDLVDFAVSTSELNLAIPENHIRLDFVDHSSPCVPSLKKSRCRSPSTKAAAMEVFLKELKAINIKITQLKNIFEDDVYNELCCLE